MKWIQCGVVLSLIVLVIGFDQVTVIADAKRPNLNAAQKMQDGKTLRIVCFGDSVTGVYYHTGSRRAYTDILGIALRRQYPSSTITMINAGISGHTTVNALARIDNDVLKHKPDLVTVMFGLNDIVRVPIDQYKRNLKEIVTKCRAIGAEVVLATPNNVINTSSRPIKKLIRYCETVRLVSQEMGTPLCDSYRYLEKRRLKDNFDWRLLMSDAIHPNMDGHKQLAAVLARTITGRTVSVKDIPPPPAIARTLRQLKEGQPIRVLAMPPFDKLIAPELRNHFPQSKIDVVSWQTDGLSLPKIEQDAKIRVRKMKPNLVIIAIPRSATAKNDEEFVNSYGWIMNWSLNFGPPTWDCFVVHPSVTSSSSVSHARDALVRRIVAAQDLQLLDRANSSDASAAKIMQQWLKRKLD